MQTIKLRADRSAGSLQLFLLMKSVIHEAQFSIFLAVDDDIASADRFASSSRRMQRNLTAANCQEFGNFVSLRCGSEVWQLSLWPKSESDLWTHFKHTVPAYQSDNCVLSAFHLMRASLN